MWGLSLSDQQLISLFGLPLQVYRPGKVFLCKYFIPQNFQSLKLKQIFFLNITFVIHAQRIQRSVTFTHQTHQMLHLSKADLHWEEMGYDMKSKFLSHSCSPATHSLP